MVVQGGEDLPLVGRDLRGRAVPRARAGEAADAAEVVVAGLAVIAAADDVAGGQVGGTLREAVPQDQVYIVDLRDGRGRGESVS